MKKTPLAIVKERFESKQKLVEAVEELATDELWIDRFNEERGLVRVSNAKLLRLHAVLTEVKEKWGSRERLINAILDLDKRSKDEGLRSKYAQYPTPRLLDLVRAATRRARKPQAASSGEQPAPKKRLVRSKKAKAKAAASA